MYPGWDLDRYFFTHKITQTATITYVVAPDVIYEVVAGYISRAESSIYYEGYIFENLDLADVISATLVARPGLTVKMLLEGGPVGGIVYTRTGRRFFNELALEVEFIGRLQTAITQAGLWAELNTPWLALDCELLPWSAKAQQLLQEQYAAVGAAGLAALAETVSLLEVATSNGAEVDPLLDQYRRRQKQVNRYAEAYRRYCWPVRSLADLKLAPFHLLASEDAVYTDKNHLWHLQTLARICAADEKLLLATAYQMVDVTDAESQVAGIRWWEELTGRGGKGMVVKPLEFIVQGQRGLVQPAVKCRGREYLRIIYGPEYTSHLDELRRRGLNAKRSLALREFALGIEALERFVRQEPLRWVHECVFGVLALESEPVDPRL